MRRMLSVLLIAMILLPMVSGCAYRDIDKRFFVVAMGIDPVPDDEKKLRISVKIALPNSEPKQGVEEFIMHTEETETVSEAIGLMKTKADKELDFGHMKLILIGEGVKDRDMLNMMDWFQRRRDIQKISWVAVGSPSAEDVLKLKIKSERLPTNALFLAFSEGTSAPSIIRVFLFDFAKKLLDQGVDPILPVVEAKKDFFQIKQSNVLKDRKLKYNLSRDETVLLNTFLLGTHNMNVKLEGKGHPLTVTLGKVKGTYKLKTVRGRLHIEAQLSGTGFIEEYKGGEQVDLLSMHHYQRKLNEELEKQTKALLVKFRKEQVDPLGFGMYYRARHFNNETELEEFKEMYPDAKIEVNGNIELVGTGLLE